MTTPSSPFINGARSNQDASANSEDFLIRTMQDDLLELQKKAETVQGTANVPPVKKIEPIPTPAPGPQKRAINPGDISSRVVHPFTEQMAIPERKKPIEVPLKDVPASTNSSSRKNLLISIVIAVVVVLLGGLYFLINRTPEQVAAPQAETAQPTEIQPEETAPPVTDVSTKKYTSEKPNYLSLNIAALSPEDIKKAILGVVEELKSMPESQTPYEFIVVDVNNNPVTFPIFANAAKLGLSASALSNLGESFSLFIYNDAENWRLSFAADTTKKDALAAVLLKQEKTLITDTSFLFLDEKPEIITGLFRDSKYKGASIRFFNVNSQITMSIDYSIVNNKLIVATSKNTIRAIIDQLIAKTPLIDTQKIAPPVSASAPEKAGTTMSGGQPPKMTPPGNSTQSFSPAIGSTNLVQ